MAILSAKPNTAAQRWARKRNFTKFRLVGMKCIIKNIWFQETLTPEERYQLEEVVYGLEKLLDQWSKGNEASKENFVRKEGF